MASAPRLPRSSSEIFNYPRVLYRVMGLLDWLDPRKTAWWNEKLWKEIERFDCHEVVEDHDSSWEIQIISVRKYRHMDSGEVRYRKVSEGDPRYRGDDLIRWEDPRDKSIEWVSLATGRTKSYPACNYEFHDDPEYES